MTLGVFLNYREEMINQHVDHPDFSALYLRHSKRLINGQFMWTLDIVQIAANEPGKGAFTRLLTHLEQYPYTIFIESVQTQKFANGLLKLGFVPHEFLEMCFYKLPK